MRERVVLFLVVGVAALLAAPPGSRAIITDETEGEEFMKELDLRFNYECNRDMVARWDYITDVADTDKEEAANDAAVRYLSFKGEAAVNATNYAYDGFSDTELYRRFRFISIQGPGALDQASLTEYKHLQAEMETIYSTATICDYHNPTQCDLTLEPDIELIMASSENWDELRYVWEEWRENTGKLMREDFVKFVNLSNRAAELDGFADTGEYWLNGYTVDQREADYYTGGDALNQAQFRDMLETVWTQVSEGLYKKLHAYVRMRLQDVYPGKIDPTGPIPSHILGDMWGQDWTNIARFVTPFPDFPTFDVTDSMVENGWDIQQMFDAAEDFFVSIDLFNMTQSFRDKSVINQTAWGKTMVCHASAEDFCLGSEGDDYRIKMCTEVNMVDLVTVHHEMGHIEYFMAYKNLPHVFRESANPGFHEAIGDLIALSVSTPKHMENILGLTPKRQEAKGSKYTEQEMRDLNFLMRMALEKIAFLPFGYLIDKYRWSVYDGSIPTSELNAGWWNLRESLQGLSPPEGGVRGEEFFDPGAKYHVPANVPYIRYFVSFIVQFQFHARLCESAGHTGPLYDCDIYNNKDAGGILRTALEKGFSEPWPKVLSELGGSADMDPQPIIDYFAPLIAYLDEVLLTAGECVGWGSDCDGGRSVEEQDSGLFNEDSKDTTSDSPSTSTEDPTTDISSTTEMTDEQKAAEAMSRMNANLTTLVQEATLLDWKYNTNATEENDEIAKEAWIGVSQVFGLYHVEVIEAYQYEEFESEDLKRQFQLQKNLGTAALETEDLEELETAVMHMTNNYLNLVCPYLEDCTEEADVEMIAIDDLEKLMGELEDYDELKYYWEEWREVSGKTMIDDYKTYIGQQNKAATKNEFEDAGHMWVSAYSDGNYTEQNFRDEIEELWKEVKPLYLKLHAYVRHHLQNKYEDINDDQLIPAHLLGNMWAQSWENIYDIVAPYPEVNITDITEDLENYIEDEKDMFRIAEDFFVSLDLYEMGEDFWENSLFVQPNDTTVVCHASAWDFYDEVEDPVDGRFRIKMCTDKNQEDFIVIHHEMGHTEYQMAYSVPTEERPLVFRDGANPGFHEAIGDTIALSVSNPNHLQKISEYLNNSYVPGEMLQDSPRENLLVPLTTAEVPSYNETINYLMKTALAKVAFLPYAYILDKWRWDLFRDPNLDYNRAWWDLRVSEQGLYPPEDRYPTWDFDPGCKYHVAAGVPYVRYFVSYILQFQFHERLCGFTSMRADDDIYNCDIYNNKQAGEELKKLLQKGASEGWHQQLQEFLIDTDKMNASSLLQYFQPLSDYLDTYIKDNDIQVGWDATNADDFMKIEVEEIPAIVPIVVGCILAVMVLAVLVAYFVGRSRQKKKAAAKKDSVNAKSTTPGEEVELEEGVASGSGEVSSGGKGSGDD